MKKFSKRGHGTMNELNITPLLDLVFVLLVIFIITTPQMVNSLDMTLPSANKPPPPKPNEAKPKISHIVVDDDGKVFLDDNFISDESIKPSFQALIDADPEHDPKVVVKGSDKVDYQNMIKVLDALQTLNITKVGLATE